MIHAIYRSNNNPRGETMKAVVNGNVLVRNVDFSEAKQLWGVNVWRRNAIGLVREAARFYYKTREEARKAQIDDESMMAVGKYK
jgi:hypothetical protein